jgi:hypothetical protein
MVSVVETRVCRACRIVTSVLTGRYGREGLTGDPEYDKDIGVCSFCRAPTIEPWPQDHPCPKCDQRMYKGNKVIMWD